MRLLYLMIFCGSFLFAMGEKIDYTVDELSRIPFKQRATAATTMLSKSVPHWKDESRIKGSIEHDKPPTLNLIAMRKLKKLAIVDLDLGVRAQSNRTLPMDSQELNLLAVQCLQSAGSALKLNGFSVATQDVVNRLLQIEPDWVWDGGVTQSSHVILHANGGAWMDWPQWIEKPLWAKDRCLRLMDTLGVDGLVFLSARVLLVQSTSQQAVFAAEPLSYGEWWQAEFAGQPKWTHFGVEMTVVTRKGLASDRLVAWSASTKGDWICPAIIVNKGSRYPILASFRVILETMASMMKGDVFSSRSTL